MAARAPPRRPEPGDELIVVHDFQARSSDELSLKKGDRVQLLERDDEFGDGWFLGRHMVSNSSGLFPEVYTRLVPKAVIDIDAFGAVPPLGSGSGSGGARTPPGAASPATNAEKIKSDKSSETPPSFSFAGSKLEAPRSEPAASIRRPSDVHDSSVLSDTLNVIEEHITNLRSPSNATQRTLITDSESEYSATVDPRMSYIAGEETDEEDEAVYTREEVLAWSADAVAEHLFTSGVEKQHCEVFRDQEITGEVLLGMDQGSLFIKALDLGSVGRRLKTWQRIKSLQDEVNSGSGPATWRTTQTYGGDTGLDGARSHSRAGTVTSRSRSRLGGPSIDVKRLSQSSRADAVLPSPVSLQLDSQSPRGSAVRPSAASIRDLNRTRRHSSNDFGLPAGNLGGAQRQQSNTHTLSAFVMPPQGQGQGQGQAQGPQAAQTTSTPPTTHKKLPSFDRNWTMGSAFGSRRLSGTGLHDMAEGNEPLDSAVDLDRGYFSGGEADGRKRNSRNLLRKRDSQHSRKSSYADEQRARSGTIVAGQSPFASRVPRDNTTAASPAAQRYYGIGPNGHRQSTSSVTSASPPLPAQDAMAPIVTRLDGARSVPPPPDDATSPATTRSGMSPAKPGVRTSGSGLRALSETVSGAAAPRMADSLREPLASPATTGWSGTPSASHSLDFGSSTAKSPSTINTTASAASKGSSGGGPRKKTKQETSAYLRGLQKVTPREAMADADYSGWMRKRGSNIMGTWKPRLFVLKGRRLAYYYSEDDEQEKGLIDISFHRVLPADGERLTGLHATITGAGSGSLPAMSGGTPTTTATTDDPEADNSIFIFKLVPPRAGLSRAVNFTKPTVHYFAVPNVALGRLWMAALVKATIDRDDSQAVTTTYQQKTISLTKARAMHHRPPALMADRREEEAKDDGNKDNNIRNFLGISIGEADSGVAGLDKVASPTDTLSSFRFLSTDDSPRTA